MVKLVEINAPAVTAEIQNLGKLFRFLWIKGVSVENLGVQRNIVNAFRMEENVDPIANAPIAATENENQNPWIFIFNFYYKSSLHTFYRK